MTDPKASPLPLLPCPFCGDEGEKGRQTVTQMNEARTTFDRIICRCCGAMAPELNWQQRAAPALPAEPTERYSFVCAGGCGVCSVKVKPFEFERTETIDGEHLGSKYQPQIVSACCGAEVHVYDNETDEWGAEVAPVAPALPAEQGKCAECGKVSTNDCMWALYCFGCIESKIVPALSDESGEVARLSAGLKWYADGNHFHADPETMDTVSGEPPNWMHHTEDETMIEDGSVARQVLAGAVMVDDPEDDVICRMPASTDAPKEQEPK